MFLEKIMTRMTEIVNKMNLKTYFDHKNGLGNLAEAMRAKFLREEIELLKKMAGSTGDISTTISVLEHQLYALEGNGLPDDG